MTPFTTNARRDRNYIYNRNGFFDENHRGQGGSSGRDAAKEALRNRNIDLDLAMLALSDLSSGGS